MNVIRINTPQRLKPIYNRYLKKKGSFDGKVKVKWSILSNGDVENAKIIEATTEYPEFEKAILDDIKQWKFEGGEYGRTTVTVPFTFDD
jgi:protein TonB